MASEQLHLCDDRREEPWNNSTGLRACKGALLVTEADGRRRLVSAHRGARKCTEASCRRRYRAKVFALALAGINEAQANGVKYTKLLTLTLPSKIIVPDEWVSFGPHWRAETTGKTAEVPPNSIQAYRYFAERFNTFQTAARREWDYKYFRVVEEGSKEPYRNKKTGAEVVGSERVHYHLLVMCRDFMRQARLSELADGAGLGPVTDIRAVTSNEKAAGYLAAYAAKDGGLGTPARMRFFVTSRGWASGYLAQREAEREGQRAARLAAGRAAVFVPPGEVVDLLASDPRIEDCRTDATRRAQQREKVGATSRATNTAASDLKVAA